MNSIKGLNIIERFRSMIQTLVSNMLNVSNLRNIQLFSIETVNISLYSMMQYSARYRHGNV